MKSLKQFLFILSLSVSNSQNIDEKSIFPPLPVAVLKSENPQCQLDSELYLQNLQNYTLWAYEMWDASAKSSSGVLRGNHFQIGNFDQCLTANAPFLTQYCLTFLQANIPKPTRERDPLSLYHDPNELIVDRLYPYEDVSQQVRNVLQVGWCIPASCSPKDIENFLNNYFNESDADLTQFNISYNAHVSDKICSNKEENVNFTVPDFIFCTLTALLTLFVICATFLEFNASEPKDEKPKPKTLFDRYFMPFSAKKNFNDLTRADESNDALGVLYGIRTICIFFIILDHRFGTYTSTSSLNFDYVERQYRAPLAPFLFHGDLFVDTFFIMGGILVTYSLLNQFDKRKINPAFIVLLRYIRLTPAYAFVIFYYATIYNYTGSGPFWKVIGGQESQDCKDNWWTNLLYVNNYVHADRLCMAHSWYLPCDFHFFILALGVCLLFQKGKKAGFGALITLTVISILIPFAITFALHRPALLHFYPEFLTAPKVHTDYLLTYIKSHTRATSYCVGIFVGYIYYRYQGKEVHVSRIKSHIIFAISVAFIMLSLVGGAVFYDPYHKYNVLESSTYAALHRPAFDIGSAGIILVSSYGHATFVRKVLTWSPWIPLSKLVYGAYLVHMQFQLRYASIFRSPREFSYFDIFNLAVADTMMSFIAALGLYLLVEAPFRRIFREILMPTRVKPATTDQVDTRTAQENVRNGSCDSRL